MSDPTALTAPPAPNAAAREALTAALACAPHAAIDPDSAAVLAGISWEQAELLLRDLADDGVLDPATPAGVSPVRYRFAPNAPARVRALPGPLREAALRRLAEWTLAVTSTTHRRTPGRTPLTAPPAPPNPAPFPHAQGAAWLDAHTGTVRTALDAAAEHRWHSLAYGITDHLWTWLTDDTPPLWAEAARIGLAAAEQAGNEAALRRMLRCSAASRTLSATPRDHTQATALWERLLEHATRADDLTDQGRAHFGLALIASEEHHTRDAASHFTQAAEAWHKADFPPGAGMALLGAGEAACRLTAWPEAIEYLDDAIDQFRDPSFPASSEQHEARARVLRGHALTHTGAQHVPTGIRAMTLGLEMLEDRDTGLWQAKALHHLADALTATDPDEATRLRDRATGLLRHTAHISDYSDTLQLVM
ncbi:tol-pal system YbgF family protein [Streptomyces uncialis]|uniref:tetratricopeptide repeat protein n=1 Tax=Streptomyces uncialis TaxID=1048205 RepID=UPI00382010AF